MFTIFLQAFTAGLTRRGEQWFGGIPEDVELFFLPVDGIVSLQLQTLT